YNQAEDVGVRRMEAAGGDHPLVGARRQCDHCTSGTGAGRPMRPAPLHHGSSWLRISPGLCSALCTFTYRLPALKLSYCASVSFAPAGTAHSESDFFSSVMIGGPFLPSGAS